MNIFWLDTDPVACAQMHCNKHVVKMPLEYAQLLSAAHHLNGSPIASRVYKLSHKHHPCTVWTANSRDAYNQVLALFKATALEYSYRYVRQHKSFVTLYNLLCDNPCPVRSAGNPPQCMPDEYKCDDVVQAYRNYYIGDKSAIAKWSRRGQPAWWE